MEQSGLISIHLKRVYTQVKQPIRTVRLYLVYFCNMEQSGLIPIHLKRVCIQVKQPIMTVVISGLFL